MRFWLVTLWYLLVLALATSLFGFLYIAATGTPLQTAGLGLSAAMAALLLVALDEEF